jgi:hypothetical protein
MKLVPVTLMITSLGCVASVALAAGSNEFYLAQCKEQVRQQYGSERDIKLVSMRRSGNSMRVKVAVRLDAGSDDVEKVEFTTCLVSQQAAPSRSESPDPTTLPATDNSVTSQDD